MDHPIKAEQSPLVKGIYPGGWYSQLPQAQLPSDYAPGIHGLVSSLLTSVPSAPKAMSVTQGFSAVFLVNQGMSAD